MIKIKQEYWLPLIVRIVVVAILSVILLSFIVPSSAFGNYLVRAVLVVFGVAALAARNYLEFNLHDNTYREYVLVMWWKFGEKIKFDSIEKLFINKINLVADVYKYATVVVPNSSQVRSSMYKCFLKFGNGEKMLLDFDTNKDRLISRLKEYNKIFRTTIYDTTSQETVVVE